MTSPLLASPMLASPFLPFLLLLCIPSLPTTLADPALGEVVQVLSLPARDAGHPKAEHKRAALLLDKIMFAVQKALDEQEKGGKPGAKVARGATTGAANMNMAEFSGPGLERRGDSHDRVYWRCYFNAVSCF